MSMERKERPEAHRNAGAFLGPDVLVPAPMSTLSDELDDNVSHRKPRHAARDSWISRLLRRLRGERA